MAKILVIEDEILLREEVMEWLTVEGYEVLGAEDGLAGVKLAINHLPDVILCDIAMPKLDGYEVMMVVRSNEATQLTPFIYMTARASQDDIRRGMESGADDYITKPFNYRQLMQAIQTRLEKKALYDQRQRAEVEQWQQAFQQEHEQRLFKSKMIAMFSHDFRNPLTNIMNANSILVRHRDNLDEQRRANYHSRIEGSIQQLVHMLEDLLVVSQMENGTLEFQPEPLNLANFIQEIVEEFRLVHGSTHGLVVDCPSAEDVFADPRLIRQIVANLVSNAIKYSPAGREVRVSLHYRDQQIIIAVEDNGIGIPEADQTRLFSAFQRASNVGQVAGTGLGLAIVQQAAQIHGGIVELESQVNIGTRVVVRIPMRGR